MTARERALKEFHLRWKKDAESDGELLPIPQQLENAWKLGWEALGKELRKMAEDRLEEVSTFGRKTAGSTAEFAYQSVITKCDELMKEKS
jgi:hypothetical protein